MTTPGSDRTNPARTDPARSNLGRTKPIRAALLLLGVAAMGYAVIGILTDDGTRPVPQFLFIAGLIVAHDGILMPLAIGVGMLVVRFVPDRVRPPVQAGLYASAVLTVFALPFILSDGRLSDNLSILPQNYVRGWLIALALVWVAAATWAGLRWRKSTMDSARMVDSARSVDGAGSADIGRSATGPAG